MAELAWCRQWVHSSVCVCVCFRRLLTRMAGHISRQWVYSPVFDQSEPLMRMAVQKVSCSPLFEQKHWWEIHPASEISLLCWRNQNHWWEWLNMHIECKFTIFEWTRITDENGLKWIQYVSSLWFSRSGPQWLNMHPDCVFTLQSLSRSDLLMRIAEHASSKWVHSPVFEQIRSTDENGWTCRKWVHSPVFQIRTTDNGGTCVQDVSLLYRVWADLNHWWGGFNTHSASESLQCLSGSEPLMRMSEHTSREWVYFLVFEQIRTTDKNGWICIQQVSLFSNVNNLKSRTTDKKWLNTHLASELLSTFCQWADQNYWHKHSSSKWVVLMFEQTGTTHENG